MMSDPGAGLKIEGLYCAILSIWMLAQIGILLPLTCLVRAGMAETLHYRTVVLLCRREEIPENIVSKCHCQTS